MCQVGIESIISRGDINLIYCSTAGRSVVVVCGSRALEGISNSFGKKLGEVPPNLGDGYRKKLLAARERVSKTEVQWRVIQPTL